MAQPRCLKLENANRDLRLAMQSSPSEATVQYAQDNAGDPGYDSWVSSTQPPAFQIETIPAGQTRWLLRAFGSIALLIFAPVDPDIEIGDAPIPGLGEDPKKLCECNGEWWICDLSNAVDCSQQNPCNGMKLVRDTEKK